MAKRKKGECPGCKDIKKLTNHHVIPKRVNGNRNGPIEKICRKCHTELEKFILKEEDSKIRNKEFYINTWDRFINLPVQTQS